MITYRLLFRSVGALDWMTEHERLSSRLEAYEAYADAVREFPQYEWKLCKRNVVLNTMLHHNPTEASDA